MLTQYFIIIITCTSNFDTGDLNHLNRSFASTTNLICLQLVTDGTLTAAGFNASFVKTYAGTDLVGESTATEA